MKDKGCAKKRITDLDKETLIKILDNSFDEIFVTDGEGTAIYVNEASERNYGLKPEQVIGMTDWQFAEEGISFPPITPIVLRDRKRVTLEQKTNIGVKLVVTATPVFDDEGNLELTVHNSRDITQIEETKKDLEQTKKLLLKYKEEVQALREKELKFNEELVTNSKQMKNLLEMAYSAARVESNVLILGESGTGKSMIARHIHNMSNRKEGPFITINCAAIPEALLESELFGYVPGAFTGANRSGKVGLIELANEGTLFLDEIAELPLKLQAKLLEVIQERRFIPVGGSEVKKIDCRLIAATNKDLAKLAQDRHFREDLYYRINVIEIEISPLRERSEDILPLIYLFLKKFNRKYNLRKRFTKKCIDILIQYPWPGNVRELEHVIERMVVTVREPVIEEQHLPRAFQQKHKEEHIITFSTVVPLGIAFEEVERELVIKAHKQLKSSYKVAEALGISQSKAFRLIKKYNSQDN